jgi:hypothetical protein
MLGVGSPEDAQEVTQWAKWLLRGGAYSVDNTPKLPTSTTINTKVSAGELASQSTAAVLDSGYIGRSEHVLPVNQEHVRNSIKHADAHRLRYWVKILREEVVREAAFNNHQSILVTQLRSLVDAQQRELVAARVSLRRMQSRLVAAKMEADTITNVSAISHEALRMAGKSRLDAQDERENLLATVDLLRSENARLLSLA